MYWDGTALLVGVVFFLRAGEAGNGKQGRASTSISYPLSQEQHFLLCAARGGRVHCAGIQGQGSTTEKNILE